MEQPILNIVGEHVALGPLRSELLPVYARWRNDPYIQRTYGHEPRPVTLEAHAVRLHAQMEDPDAHWFTVYELHDDGAVRRPIGTTTLFDIDYRYFRAEYGVLLGEPDARGRGYGTEVTRLMLDFAFNTIGLRNVMLTVAIYNIAGRRAYERAGFREFGRRRQSDEMGGVVYDDIYMDCVPEDLRLIDA